MNLLESISLANLLFWFLSAVIFFAALIVILARRIIRATFALSFVLAGVAGIYFFLGADFLGAAQLLVYVGGVMVLILFAVALSPPPAREPETPDKANFLLGALLSGAFFTLLAKTVFSLPVPERFPGAPAQLATAKGLGSLLLGEYVLPFEVLSLVLLVALIAAVVLVRKEIKG